MIFQIISKQEKQSAKGTSYAIATLTNDKGTEFNNVTLFSPASTKNVGEAIIGELDPNDYKGKVGWKFKEEKTTGSYPKRGPAPFAAAVKAKQEGISHSMDRKEEAIQKASVIRDATLLTVASTQGKGIGLDDMKKEWDNWHSWLESKWSNPF